MQCNATRWRWRRNRDLKKTVPAGYGRMQRGGDTNLENHMYHKHSQTPLEKPPSFVTSTPSPPNKPIHTSPIPIPIPTPTPFAATSSKHAVSSFSPSYPEEFLSVREPSRICFFSLPPSASPLVFPSFSAIISSLDLVLAEKIPCCYCWRMGLAELMGIEGGGGGGLKGGVGPFLRCCYMDV